MSIYKELKSELSLGFGKFHLNNKDLIKLMSDQEERRKQEKIKNIVLSQININLEGARGEFDQGIDGYVDKERC